jgi:hypothetical protein
MLGATLVHPDHSHVLLKAPEPIIKQDGVKKNDCERNAAKRLLENIRKAHPRIKFIVVEEADWLPMGLTFDNYKPFL